MIPPDNEEELLRSVALQNAKAILEARQRAEQELIQANQALELKSAELAQSLAMLHATLESTADGILVTDGGGLISGFNEKLLSMWDVPRTAVQGGTHLAIVDDVAARFADPQRFRERVREIYAASPPESHDVLELIDGRVFERFSRPLSVERPACRARLELSGHHAAAPRRGAAAGRVRAIPDHAGQHRRRRGQHRRRGPHHLLERRRRDA